jgi:uracil DNA glycosylase superfamily protein
MSLNLASLGTVIKNHRKYKNLTTQQLADNLKENNKMYLNYIEKIRKLPIKQKYDKQDLLTDNFLIEQQNNIKMYWAPFEYINKNAKVVLLGITPGWTQMEQAIRCMRTNIDNKSLDELLIDCKKEASFCGSMRTNLISMLDDIGLNSHFSIESTSELFNKYNHLVHTSSVLRYPIFINEENYTGYNPRMLKTDILLDQINTMLVDELNHLENAIIIPLGKSVSEILKYLSNNNKINNELILFDFPHPSGANAHRKSQFERNKDLFKQKITKVS